MRWAYTGMVRPMLSYGALVWAHETNQQHIKDCLQKVNRLAINTFCVVARSTPTRALEIILDVMPLHLFCRSVATATFFRIRPNLEFGWPGKYSNVYYSVSHMKYWTDIKDLISQEDDQLDVCNESNWNKNFTINKESKL